MHTYINKDFYNSYYIVTIQAKEGSYFLTAYVDYIHIQIATDILNYNFVMVLLYWVNSGIQCN